MIFFFSPCNVYNPSQFSLVRGGGENQALKCKVMCVNHHLLQRELHAAIPGGHTLPGQEGPQHRPALLILPVGPQCSAAALWKMQGMLNETK